MNLSRACIERPVATTLLMVALALLGIFSMLRLPRASLPVIEYPTIQVTAQYPGASPEVMASAVTAPLEKQFGTMTNLAQMASSSTQGSTRIDLQFDLELPLDIAEQEVQAAITAASGFLPPDLPTPPVYAKINPADPAILSLSVTSASLTLIDLEDLAETRLFQKLSQTPGVGGVSILGGHRPAIRVRFNSAKLASLGLSAEELRVALTSSSLNAPKGLLETTDQVLPLDTNDQLLDVEGYARTIIAYRNGRPVTLSDVASVVRAPESSQLSASINKRPALVLDIRRQPGANAVQIVDRIRAELPSLQAALPGAAHLEILTDRTASIRIGLRNVQLELTVAVVLVVLILYVFLRSPTVTLIPSLSVPLSLLGGLIGMAWLGFSLDNLSLMALTIAAGFVVDDAILVIENISRHLEAGSTALQAARTGSEEIGFTILSLTLSLLAVLIPLLFMGDIIGRLFHEFALALAITIAVSAVVSLTFVPMLCARLLRPRPRPASDRFDRVIRYYSRRLDWLLEHPSVGLVTLASTLLLALMVAIDLPKGLFPLEDTGLIQIITIASPSTTYSDIGRAHEALAVALLKEPDVQQVSSYIGIDSTNAILSTGRLQIALRPQDERLSRLPDILTQLRARAAAVPGIRCVFQVAQDLTVETHPGPGQYRFSLVHPDAALLQKSTSELLAELSKGAKLIDLTAEPGPPGSGVELVIDRIAAGRYGLTPATIDDALYNAFAERIVSTLFTQSNQYRVILEASPQQTPIGSQLDSIYLSVPQGRIPLSAVVSMQPRSAPQLLHRIGRLPAINLSFNLPPETSLDEVAAIVTHAEHQIGLPESIQTVFQGPLAAFQSSVTHELYLVLAAVLVMYIVLGILYESFFHPLTILSTLPSASVGALLALKLSSTPLDVVAVIGILLLIGLVKKNAIMVVDFALAAEREQGLTPRAAIHQACLLRLRPILMTTAAALFSALPLLLGTGMGSELRQPLGIVIAGGLVASQLLTLFTTPVVYLTIDSLMRRLRGPNASRFTQPSIP